jgi:hypothetical protein
VLAAGADLGGQQAVGVTPHMYVPSHHPVVDVVAGGSGAAVVREAWPDASATVDFSRVDPVVLAHFASEMCHMFQLIWKNVANGSR